MCLKFLLKPVVVWPIIEVYLWGRFSWSSTYSCHCWINFAWFPVIKVYSEWDTVSSFIILLHTCHLQSLELWTSSSLLSFFESLVSTCSSGASTLCRLCLSLICPQQPDVNALEKISMFKDQTNSNLSPILSPNIRFPSHTPIITTHQLKHKI